MNSIVWVGEEDLKQPERWAVKGVVGGLTVVWGAPGSCKTFLGISLSVAVASGRHWFGHPVRQGPVLYIVGEGGVELFRRRVIEAARASRTPFDKLPIALWPSAADLSSPEALEAFWPVWDAVSPVMVVVDTVSRCLTGDENKQETMQRFIASCDTIRDRYQASVLCIHHTNKQNNIRGSSVLPAAADVSLHVWRTSDGHGRMPLSFKPHKLKELSVEDFEPKQLHPTVVDVKFKNGNLMLDEFGAKVTTLVLSESPTARENVIRAYAAFDRLAASRSPIEAVTYKEWREAVLADMSDASFKRALSDILAEPDKYDVEHHGRGQYTRRAEKFFIEGVNYDPVEDGDDELA